MKDVYGNSVEVGDTVSFTILNASHQSIVVRGQVVEIHPDNDMCWVWLEGRSWEDGKWSKLSNGIRKVSRI